MSTVNIGLLVVMVAAWARGAAGADWSYSDAGQWGEEFPNCGGQQQSPIDLSPDVPYSFFILPVEFHYYDVLPATQVVTNDGHSLKVAISDISDAPYISWGGSLFFPYRQYNFAQYHFHWGSDSSQGSEHTMDNAMYPMELHLVHFNDKYSDIGAAVSEPDGLAVLGIFFVISKYDNPALVPLLEAIAEITDYNSEPNFVEKDTLYALSSLLPSDTERFFRYDGSLTTPTCDESVLWTVFEEPIDISEDQMEVFRNLIGSDGSSSDNFRPIQASNGRTVRKTF